MKALVSYGEHMVALVEIRLGDGDAAGRGADRQVGGCG